ncbi:MAG: hypothetical protein EZS28_002465 [Streblomastix strix]|uniref:Uncharacterized protein n=1 Tax=Streblomastix strix TaxID=222440 RepID=A0A5J4X5E8_9EUKA|nr:MAG: hypothetical protein EZS28_002465 [Streblomastix strix]
MINSLSQAALVQLFQLGKLWELRILMYRLERIQEKSKEEQKNVQILIKETKDVLKEKEEGKESQDKMKQNSKKDEEEQTVKNEDNNAFHGKTVTQKFINAIIRRRAIMHYILVALEVLVRDGGEGIRRLFTNALLSDIPYDQLPNSPSKLIRLVTCDDRILNKATTESVDFLISDDDLPNTLRVAAERLQFNIKQSTLTLTLTQSAH